MTQVMLILADEGWGHMDFDGGWWVVMVVAMALFWAIVIGAVIWAVRAVPARGGRSQREPTALEVLDRRFAEGDITTEDYTRRRAVLEGREADPGR